MYQCTRKFDQFKRPSLSNLEGYWTILQKNETIIMLPDAQCYQTYLQNTHPWCFEGINIHEQRESKHDIIITKAMLLELKQNILKNSLMLTHAF